MDQSYCKTYIFLVIYINLVLVPNITMYEKAVLTIIGVAAIITTLTVTTERGMFQQALAVHFACQGGSGTIEACPPGQQGAAGTGCLGSGPCNGHSEQAPGFSPKANSGGPPVPHSSECSSSDKDSLCSSKDASPGQEFKTG
jgi:hypothetical protein